MEGYQFDSAFVANEVQDYRPIPEDRYVLRITETRPKEVRDESGNLVKSSVQFVYEVVEGEYAGRLVFENFHFYGVKPGAIDRAWYYQMVGRGFRIHPEKDYCLILDFGQNIERHGPVDALCVKTSRQGSGGTAPVKTCPRCELVTLASARVCPDCGFEFPIVTAPEKVDFRSSRLNILSSEPGLRVRSEDLTTIGEHEVFKTTYFKHRKLVDDAPTYSLRVHYETAEREYREWVCPEHYGYARQKFEKWWAKRSPVAPPDTVDAALASIKNDGFAPTLKITVRKKPGDAYEEIVKYELGEKPDSFDFAEPDATAQKCVDCLSYRRGRCYLNPDAPKDAPPSLKACSSYCLESDIPF